MKKFKTIDVWISITLICAALGYGISNHDYFIYGYFVVGGWHIISMIVHAYYGWFTGIGGRRRTYHFIVGILIAFTLVDLLIMYLFPRVPVLNRISVNILLPELFVLLFAAPVMAVYYTALCYRELYIKMERPLAKLK